MFTIGQVVMQKRTYILGLQLLTLSSSLPAFAATLPNDHSASLGAELFYYQYREPGLMRSKGPLYGMNGAYNFAFCNGFFLQPDARFAYGRTKYTSNGTGSLKNEPNWLFETRLLFGKKFKLNATTHIDPFLGFGYRYKSDDASKKTTTTGHFGYYRRSQYFYIPLGLTLHHQLDNCWTLSPTAEFDWFLRGKQRSDIFETVHNKQKKGFGLRGDFMATYKLQRGSFSFGPFVNYWKIKDSEHTKVKGVSVGLEPKNQTIEAGIKIKYNF